MINAKAKDATTILKTKCDSKPSIDSAAAHKASVRLKQSQVKLTGRTLTEPREIANEKVFALSA